MGGVSLAKVLYVHRQARLRGSQSHINNITTYNEYLDEESEYEQLRTKYFESIRAVAVFMTGGLTLYLLELNSSKDTSEKKE